jgi:hypothetical protein
MSDGYAEETALKPLARVLAIFHSPGKVFEGIDRGAPWWEPWVLASLLNMVAAYVVIPINTRLFSLNPHGLSPEELGQGLETLQKFSMKYLGVITAPMSVLFAALVFSAVSYIVVSVLSERPDFKKHLAVYLYSSIVMSVGIVVSNLIVRWNGIENIQTIGDAVAPLGPAALVPVDERIWFALLSTLDVFSVWSYVLFGLGVMYVFGLSRRAAVLTVLPLWLLAVLIALVEARFGSAP